MTDHPVITPGCEAVGNALPCRAFIRPMPVHPQPYPRSHLPIRPRVTGTPFVNRFWCARSLLCDRRLNFQLSRCGQRVRTQSTIAFGFLRQPVFGLACWIRTSVVPVPNRVRSLYAKASLIGIPDRN